VAQYLELWQMQDGLVELLELQVLRLRVANDGNCGSAVDNTFLCTEMGCSTGSMGASKSRPCVYSHSLLAVAYFIQHLMALCLIHLSNVMKIL
jgi:hypothetical protein